MLDGELPTTIEMSYKVKILMKEDNVGRSTKSFLCLDLQQPQQQHLPAEAEALPSVPLP